MAISFRFFFRNKNNLQDSLTKQPNQHRRKYEPGQYIKLKYLVNYE